MQHSFSSLTMKRAAEIIKGDGGKETNSSGQRTGEHVVKEDHSAEKVLLYLSI